MDINIEKLEQCKKLWQVYEAKRQKGMAEMKEFYLLESVMKFYRAYQDLETFEPMSKHKILQVLTEIPDRLDLLHLSSLLDEE
jgi:hypothetical protein